MTVPPVSAVQATADFCAARSGRRPRSLQRRRPCRSHSSASRRAARWQTPATRSSSPPSCRHRSPHPGAAKRPAQGCREEGSHKAPFPRASSNCILGPSAPVQEAAHAAHRLCPRLTFEQTLDRSAPNCATQDAFLPTRSTSQERIAHRVVARQRLLSLLPNRPLN